MSHLPLSLMNRLKTEAVLLLWFILIEPGHEKTCLVSYANSKGADQPAHPRSLISAFVFRCLDSL